MTSAERTKAKNTGVWIDHKEAILVELDEENNSTVERILSEVDSHFRPSGGWKASGTSVAQSVSKEQKADERHKHQLAKFYKEVINKTGTARHIYLFGPGEAKLELAKEFKKTKILSEKIRAVETSDRITENQIVAKVKSFFAK